MVLGQTLYIAADDGEHGKELWRTDGTPEGTSLVRDIVPGPDGSSLDPEVATAVGDTLYLFAQVPDPDPAAEPVQPTGRRPPPGAQSNHELWRTDGTQEGTVFVREFEWSGGSLLALGDTLYFVADDGERGRELWRSDGTAEGTTLVKDIRVGEDTTDGRRPSRLGNGSWPGWLTAIGDTIYFDADDGEHGRELWRSDGTPEGTVLVRDVHPGPDPSSFEIHPTVAGDAYYFAADDGEHGTWLWRSDGTLEGTMPVGETSGSVGQLDIVAAAGDSVYFQTWSSCTHAELWRADATTNEATRLLTVPSR
jgi:ELWxxDGT repeat protein